ncbi:MAG TPA: protein-glutamine glutaminase family protein [Pyrinomonadaceae bacterium]|nr:protein-glutamine glutaminase family protein [Pyrinomonadaceae bacterium]
MGEVKGKLGKVVRVDEDANAEGASPAERFLDATGGLGGVNFELNDGTVYSINRLDPRFNAWLTFLRSRRESGRPVYVEDDEGSVKEVYAPSARRVAGISRDTADGRLLVTLPPTPSPRYLNPAHPHFGDLLSKLEAAHRSNEKVLVTVNPYNDEIVDVSPADEPDPSGVVPNGAVAELDAPADKNLTLDLSPFSIGIGDAFREFDFLATRPHIAFSYIKDCCASRAHEMCELLRRHSVRSGKIWLYGRHYTATQSNYPLAHYTLGGVHEENPSVVSPWLYHVAPVVSVTQDDSSTSLMVMDPAQFRTPKSVARWIRHHGDTGARHIFSSPRVWFRSPEGVEETDDGFDLTEQELDKHRYHGNLLRLPRPSL